MNIKYLSISILAVSLSLSAFAETKATKVVSADEQARVFQMVGQDSNKLLKTGAAYSMERLTKTKKLSPFALILNNDGSIGKLEPLLPFIVKAPINDKINYLRGQIKHFAEKGEIKAGSLFSRGFGRTEDKNNELSGLIVESEHRNGPSTVQFVPLEMVNGSLVAKESTAKPKPRLFFNRDISSEKTYEQIKQVVSHAEK